MEAMMKRTGGAGQGAWARRILMLPPMLMLMLKLTLMLPLTLTLTPAPLHGQGPGAPDLLPYQGSLVNGDGTPLGSPSPKNYDVVFRIFDASSGGTLVWSEQQTVTVDAGRFSVQIGLGSGIGTEPRPALGTIFRTLTASDRYLETTVKAIGPGRADSTQVPRTRLLAGPYAMFAQHARSADQIVNSGRGSVMSIVGARVGINTTNPATALDVAGSALAASLRVNGATRVQGVATASAWVGGGAAPVGSIILWSGAAAERPDGWAICDGTVVNGYRTPDLRGRFIVGAGTGPGLSERVLGAVGGAETHVLAEAELPTHAHSLSGQTAMLGGSGSHYHDFRTEVGGEFSVPHLWVGGDASGNMTSHNRYGVFTAATAAHQHSFDMPATASTSAGGGQAHANMPPFYVLAYIVRVQ